MVLLRPNQCNPTMRQNLILPSRTPRNLTFAMPCNSIYWAEGTTANSNSACLLKRTGLYKHPDRGPRQNRAKIYHESLNTLELAQILNFSLGWPGKIGELSRPMHLTITLLTSIKSDAHQFLHCQIFSHAHLHSPALQRRLINSLPFSTAEKCTDIFRSCFGGEKKS